MSLVKDPPLGRWARGFSRIGDLLEQIGGSGRPANEREKLIRQNMCLQLVWLDPALHGFAIRARLLSVVLWILSITC